MHFAIAKGNPAIVKILLDHGADIEKQASDTNGSQPLHWAVFFLQEDVVEILLERGADVNSVDENDSTPLDVLDWLRSVNTGDESRRKSLSCIEDVLTKRRRS